MMEPETQEYIFERLKKMDSDFDNLEWDIQYARALNIYYAIDGDAQDYDIEYLIDSETLIGKWYWRLKR